tara:strand:- start:918 stop:1712 length:795 start_codon:yes stop_codon:yes gene_type:complete
MYVKNLVWNYNMIDNAIYSGTIKHRRFIPFNRSFTYTIFMNYFDISKIDSLFKKSYLWNVNKFALVSFFRKDYHGNPSISLDTAVRNTIKEKTKITIDGPIRILTHLRYFGYCFNPVSFYYCFDKTDTKVELIMAEVTNTPWNERYSYFITNKKNKTFKEDLKKNFHVSPFWGMDHDYEWIFTEPKNNLNVNMINFKDAEKIFHVTLDLKNKKNMTLKNLVLYTLKYPFLTLMVFLRIHFQALILLLRGAKFYNHPKFDERKSN